MSTMIRLFNMIKQLVEEKLSVKTLAKVEESLLNFELRL